MESEKQQSFLAEYVRIIARKKVSIMILCLITILVGIILFFFVIDPVYFSEGTIKSTGSSGGLGSLISSSAIPDLGDLSEIAGSTTISKELALFETILLSRRCLEETINKFGLMEENEYKFMQDAIKDFRENIISVEKDKVAGTMDVGTYNKSPEKARDMAEFLISQLNKINIEMNIQNAKNNREFIEQRYMIAQKELKQVEDSLTDFQNNFGVSPDFQIQAALKAEVELEAEIKAEEVKLELLKKILAPSESEILAQQEKINLMKEQLGKIQTGDFSDSKLSIKGSPSVIMNFLRLKRNVEIQNKIISTLVPLVEKAKIDENRETPTIMVLDSPAIPERKSKPKRITSIALMTFVVFSLSSFYYIFKEKYFPLLRSIIS